MGTLWPVDGMDHSNFGATIGVINMGMDKWETAVDIGGIRESETPMVLHSVLDFALTPAGKTAVYAGMMGLGIGFVLLAVAPNGRLWFILPGLLFLFSGAGGILMLIDRLRRYEIQYSLQREETVSAAPSLQGLKREPGKRWVDFGNGMGGFYYWEPAPGALTKWLADVLDGRSTLGYWNEGKPRGWSKPNYLTMIAQLRQQGILDNEPASKNSPPAFTNTGRGYVAEWVGGSSNDN